MSAWKCRWLMICTGLWTAAGLMATWGSIVMSARLMFWSLLATMVSALVTGHLIANEASRRERLKLEHLADIMARAAAEQTSVSNIRR